MNVYNNKYTYYVLYISKREQWKCKKIDSKNETPYYHNKLLLFLKSEKQWKIYS